MGIMKKLRIYLFVSISCAIAGYGSGAEAKLIQVLHTNDLHAALETEGAPKEGEPEYGGWAQLKKAMDAATLQASLNGIESIRLDAGDFTEGSTFYFPNHGAGVIQAFQHLGYDAVVMGNHDWLMGARSLDDLYGEKPFPFPVLSANIKIQSGLKNLTKTILPSTQLIRNGIKIGVFGLSTDEALYSWIPRVNSKKREMKIQDYRDDIYEDDGESGTRIYPGIANQLIEKLRAENDVVIGLTHIGLDEDQLLAANSRGLDLIVGGHSHSLLEKPSFTNDLDGKKVPIVQVGMNGKYFGKMILNIEPGQRPQLISYELVPVLRNDAKDALVENDVNAAKNQRNTQFGNEMNRVVGISEDRLVSGAVGPTAFSKFVVDSMRDTAQADVGIDVGAFHGSAAQAAGPVTRLNLIEMYPRKFERDQNQGLYVYEAKVPGILIRIGLNYAVRFGTHLEMSGVTYDLEKISPEKYKELKDKYADSSAENIVTPYRVRNIKVGGKPLKGLYWYKVAAPESLVRGAFGVSIFTHLVIRQAKPTHFTLWEAMIAYLHKTRLIPKREVDLGPNPWAAQISSHRSILQDFVIQSVDELKEAVTSEDYSQP